MFYVFKKFIIKTSRRKLICIPKRECINEIRTYGFDTEVYLRLMSKSIFSLCPRGSYPTSWRLYESILYDAIPIIITNDPPFLPFIDIMNWNKFSFIINSQMLKNFLLYVKKNINNYTLKYMKQEMTFIKKYFTSNIIFDYIFSLTNKYDFNILKFVLFRNNYQFDLLDS